MDKPKFTIAFQEYPSAITPYSILKEEKTGLQIGKAIQYEWFNGGTNGSFFNRWEEFHKIRLFARGEQDVQKYKNELAYDGDLSYLNLDWTPIPIMPKLIDLIVNGMHDRLFKIKANSQDSTSQKRRIDYQNSIKGQMLARPLLEVIQEKTGVDPFTMDPDSLPENDEELSLRMQLEYKPSIEIAEEVAINTLLEDNDFLNLRKRFEYDQTTIGLSVGTHEFQRGAGVVLRYVDPATYVHSYTEDPFFKDCFYHGHVQRIHIGELLKINPDLSTEDLEEISNTSTDWNTYFRSSSYYSNDSFSKDSVTVLFFNYKATKKEVYKKKIHKDSNTIKMIKKDEDFNPPPEMMEEYNFERAEKSIDVWFDGVMVLGSEKIIKWELMKNMVRPKSASQHAISSYVATAPRMYKGRIESIGKRLIPFIEQMQLIHMKTQQVASKMVPDGVFIDADGLNQVDLGNGATYGPKEALSLYFQTGSVVGRSYTQDGEINAGKIPIQELNSSSGMNKISMLISSFNHYMDLAISVIGLNSATDASSPDPNSLVGIQKMAALNSNTATRHILDSCLYMFKAFGEAMSCRISDILEYADFADEFINKIGKYNTGLLNEIKDLHLYDFGIYLEVAPDIEEKADLQANIQIALSKEDINIEDAIDIREIKNIKLANQLLKLKRKRKEEREERIAKEAQAMQGQIQLQSQEAAKAMAMEKIQLETQGKITVIQVENSEKGKLQEKEANLKLMLMDKEFNYQMKLKGLESRMLQEKEDKRETAKSDRISQQNTEMSKMIQQRSEKLPAMNFESNEDSLDGFGLDQFSPR